MGTRVIPLSKTYFQNLQSRGSEITQTTTKNNASPPEPITSRGLRSNRDIERCIQIKPPRWPRKRSGTGPGPLTLLAEPVWQLELSEEANYSTISPIKGIMVVIRDDIHSPVAAQPLPPCQRDGLAREARQHGRRANELVAFLPCAHIQRDVMMLVAPLRNGNEAGRRQYRPWIAHIEPDAALHQPRLAEVIRGPGK